MAAAVPRLDLGQDGDQAYSPSSAPFGHRPAARTPAGRSLLMSTNPLFDQGGESTAAKPAVDEGEQTPRLGAAGKLSDLKGGAGPVSSARKWLAGQARSPAGAALAGSVASPTRVAVSPVQLPAAAAAHLAADAPTPRLLASAGKLTPRTDTGVAPSPATQFPRSFPVAVGAKAPEAAVAAPTGGLATWLRMSSHLSKPTEAAAEPASPAGSEASLSSSGSGGSHTRTVASLDFQSVEKQPAAKAEAAKAAGAEGSTAAAAPAAAPEPAAKPAPAAAPEPVAKPAPAAELAVAAAPQATQSAASSQPTRAATERRSMAVRTERSSLLSLPAVQLVLLCLLGGLLLAAPLAMRAFNPTLTQRYLPGRISDVSAHFRKLSAVTSKHAAQLNAAATQRAGQLKAAASRHASQLHAAALRQAQQAHAAAQQAQQAVKQAYSQRLAASQKAAPVTAVPAQPTTKPAPVEVQQQPQLKQQQATSKKPAKVAKAQAAAPMPQRTTASQPSGKATAPAVVKAPSKAPATQPKQASVPASSPGPAAVKPQAQPAAKPQPVKPKPQLATASQPAAVQPAASAKRKATAQPVQQPLHTQAAALAAARLAPMWQQLRARLPFIAPPAAPVSAAEAATPRREVQPSALAAAAAAAVAGLAALAALGMRTASNDDAATAEEAVVDEEPEALPAFPTTTPAVGGRASRARRQSEAVIAEAEDEGLPSVAAPRQRRASALPAATPGTAPRTSRRKSAAPAEVPASPTSTVTTRRRSMRLAA